MTFLFLLPFIASLSANVTERLVTTEQVAKPRFERHIMQDEDTTSVASKRAQSIVALNPLEQDDTALSLHEDNQIFTLNQEDCNAPVIDFIIASEYKREVSKMPMVQSAYTLTKTISSSKMFLFYQDLITKSIALDIW